MDGAYVMAGAGRSPMETALSPVKSLKQDLTVLRHMWFSKAKGDDHAARLENFYGPQAKACKCTKSGLHNDEIYLKPTFMCPLQMTSSAPTSFGVASPCWQPVLRV